MDLPTIAAMATLSLGMPNSTPQQNLYVQASADVQIDPHLSFRSDVFWFAGEQNQSSRLTQNHSLLSGIAYHFSDGAVDPYLTFQPGFALTQTEYKRDGTSQSSALRITALASSAAGARFYVSDHFHFFAEGRQVLGRHRSDDPRGLSLSETRLSFGLGGQIGRKTQ